MSKKFLVLAGAALTLSLAACSSEGPGLVTAASPLPAGEGEAGRATVWAEDLKGTWFLESLEQVGSAALKVGEPDRYVARFEAENRVAVRSDCNRCAGGYNASSTELRLSPLACTRAYCGDTSLDSRFERVLGAAERWSMANSRLTLDGSAGRLVFTR